MIQRKQSLFLLGAVIAIVACLFFPLIAVEPAAMGSETLVFNLGVRDTNGIISFLSWPLFASLSIAAVISLATIFLYRNRKLQMRLCLWAMGFELIWHVYLALFFLGTINLPTDGGHMRLCFAACLPLVSIILLLMARKGISDDEKLVKAADRIR